MVICLTNFDVSTSEKKFLSYQRKAKIGWKGSRSNMGHGRTGAPIFDKPNTCPSPSVISIDSATADTTLPFTNRMHLNFLTLGPWSDSSRVLPSVCHEFVCTVKGFCDKNGFQASFKSEHRALNRQTIK